MARIPISKEDLKKLDARLRKEFLERNNEATGYRCPTLFTAKPKRRAVDKFNKIQVNLMRKVKARLNKEE